MGVIFIQKILKSIQTINYKLKFKIATYWKKYNKNNEEKCYLLIHQKEIAVGNLAVFPKVLFEQYYKKSRTH